MRSNKNLVFAFVVLLVLLGFNSFAEPSYDEPAQEQIRHDHIRDEGILYFENGAHLFCKWDLDGEHLVYQKSWSDVPVRLPTTGQITDFPVNNGSLGWQGWYRRYGHPQHYAHKRFIISINDRPAVAVVQTTSFIYVIDHDGRMSTIAHRDEFAKITDDKTSGFVGNVVVYGKFSRDSNDILLFIKLASGNYWAFIANGLFEQSLGEISRDHVYEDISRKVEGFNKDLFKLTLSKPSIPLHEPKDSSIQVSHLNLDSDFELSPDYKPASVTKEKNEMPSTHTTQGSLPLADPSNSISHGATRFGSTRPVVPLTTDEEKFLNQCVDLTAEVKSSDKIFDVLNPEELNGLRRALIKKEVGSVVIVGDSGSGKTELVRSFVKKITEGAYPEIPATTKVIQIDAATLVGGTRNRGEFEEKVSRLKSIARKRPDIIFFLDEVQSFRGAGTAEGSPMDFFQLIRTELANGTLRFIGTTTPDDYNAYLAGDPSLRRRAPAIYKKPIPKEKLVSILTSWSEKVGYEPLSAQMLERVLQLSQEFDAAGTELSKAVRLLEDVYANAVILNKSADDLTVKDVDASAAWLYQIDPAEFDSNLRLARLHELPAKLDQRLFGLDDVKKALVEDMTMALTGTQNRNFPRIRRLFAGPRGIAKTYTARVFAESMGLPFVLISMSEYASGKTADDLLRAVARALRKNPFSVVLFDEIEKAPLYIQNSLLQILYSDHFTVTETMDGSSHGKALSMDRINVNGASFFATTNAGENFILKFEERRASPDKGQIGFKKDEKQSKASRQKGAHQEGESAKISSNAMKKAVEADGVSPYLADRMVGVHAFYPPRSSEEFKNVLSLKLHETLAEQKAYHGDVQVKNEEAYLERLATEYYRPGMSYRDVLAEMSRAVGLALAYEKIAAHSRKAQTQCKTWLLEL